LTISFIENAFKHGISYQENSFISITFSFTANRLFFEIKNTIQNKTIKPKNSGLGIENARNRLNLIYGNDYELVIEQVNNKIFFVKLNIPI
jgi:LytS/YehU family sensor histidine kinase